MNNLKPAHQVMPAPAFRFRIEHTPNGLVLFVGPEGGTVEHGYPMSREALDTLLVQAGRLLEAA